MQALAETSLSPPSVSLALQPNERWYVVRTNPHRETQAARQLENQDLRVFLPRFFKGRRHTRKFETVLAPLFPRYMFLILDLQRDRWRSVNGTLGVDRLLMRAGAPEPVPHELVEQLTEAVSADGVDAVRAQGRPKYEGDGGSICRAHRDTRASRRPRPGARSPRHLGR